MVYLLKWSSIADFNKPALLDYGWDCEENILIEEAYPSSLKTLLV